MACPKIELFCQKTFNLPYKYQADFGHTMVKVGMPYHSVYLQINGTLNATQKIHLTLGIL
jgi:hypothetical protein